MGGGAAGGPGSGQPVGQAGGLGGGMAGGPGGRQTGGMGAFFGPNVDGWAIPTGFADAYTQGKQADVSFIIDWNAGGSASMPTTVENYCKQAQQRYGALADEFLAAYPVATDEEASAMQTQAQRDSIRVSLFLWAGSRQKSGPNKTFIYSWSHSVPGPNMERFGAFSTSEIPYIMGALSKSDRPFTKEDYAISDMMSAYWVNFAATGDPNGKGLPVWPAFNPDNKVIFQLDDEPESIPIATDARFEFSKRYFATQPAW